MNVARSIAVSLATMSLLPIGRAAEPTSSTAPQANNVAYFAIHADDVERARKFYSTTFGWAFMSIGIPEYYLIRTGTPAQPGITGGLERRVEPLPSAGTRTFECTISVESIEAIATAIASNGGRIVVAPREIPGVGKLLYFLDTEGNRAGAMQYSIPTN